MKNKSLWKVSVVTSPEAEEAVVELCQTILGQPAVSWTDVKTSKVAVSVYLRERPVVFQAALSEGLANLRRCQLKTGPATISLKEIRRENWAEAWKRHFRPIQIGAALLVKPGWHKQRPRKGQAVVVLNPGLSFGTGQHPTTAFCLKQLTVRRDPNQQQSFLDIGTGSGILAIAAARLGYSPVGAFDFDPEAVRIARANARLNGVLGKTRIHRADLTRLPTRSARRYDLICANLISTLLLAECRRVLTRLRPGGVLVLAGILRTEFPKVQRSYERMGLQLVKCRIDKEWRSGAFVFRDEGQL